MEIKSTDEIEQWYKTQIYQTNSDKFVESRYKKWINLDSLLMYLNQFGDHDIVKVIKEQLTKDQ